jgi:chromosome segregation ATPase
MREENEATLAEAHRVVDGHDRQCGELRNRLQRHDLELDSRRRELEKAGNSLGQRRNELGSLASAKSGLQQAERDEAETRQQHDEFMSAYPAKTAEMKNRIKVSL